MLRRHHLPGPLHRAVAMLGAALVLALTLLAASPTAHNWLHSAAGLPACAEHTKPQPIAPGADHDCVVVLFASGVDTPAAAITFGPPRMVRWDISPATAAEFYLVSPRYLRQPERGPPSSRVA